MKRKIMAWTAAILIIAAVSACFLRPLARPRNETLYTISEPVKIELYGKDADRFEVYILGFGTFDRGLDPNFRIAVRSLDGNYYSLGRTRWVEGWSANHSAFKGPHYEGDNDTSFGYVERLGEGGWEKCVSMYDTRAYNLGFTGVIYNFIWPTEQKTPEEYNSEMNLPYRAPGRYRVTMFARDYVPKMDDPYISYEGSSGDRMYEFQFEYEVPERSEEPIEVMRLHLETGVNEMTGEVTALLNASLRANGNIRYIQPDTMAFERRDPLTGRYSEVVSDSKYGAFWFQNTRTYINAERRLRESAESGSLNYDIEEVLSIIPMYNVCLFGWNTRDEYRLSVDFTENVDGSGERYTLTLRLEFDK